MRARHASRLALRRETETTPPDTFWWDLCRYLRCVVTTDALSETHYEARFLKYPALSRLFQLVRSFLPLPTTVRASTTRIHVSG